MKYLLIILCLMVVGCSHVHKQGWDEQCYKDCLFVDEEGKYGTPGWTYGTMECIPGCKKPDYIKWWYQK